MIIVTEARRLYAAGLPLLPNDPVKKFPSGYSGWERRTFTTTEIESHVRRGGALGVRMGDDREAIDLDAKHWIGDDRDELRRLFEELVEGTAPGLLERLLIETTPTDGRHYVYRCAVVGENMKLAERLPTDEERQKQPRRQAVTLIETRGNGGQVQIAPSPGYTMVQGDWANLPEITPEERDILMACARAMHQVARQSAERPNAGPGGERPGDHYNRNGGQDEALQLLESDGWTIARARGNVAYLTRPGGTRGHIHATYGAVAPGVFYPFTSNCSPFEPETGYSPFAVLATLQHGGDYKAAARELAQRYGMSRARSDTPAAPPAPALHDGTTPSIDITDENLGRATAAIWEAMRVSRYGPNLYRYGTEIAYLDGTLTTIDDTRWRGMVNRAAAFVTVKLGKNGPNTSEVLPPLAMVRDSLIFAPDDLPMIERVSPLPVFDAAGRLLTNGYHADSRTLVTSEITPAAIDAGHALALIRDDLLTDFPFASDADRANAIAYILLPFVRELCGAMPLFLIDAAQRGTGKTLLNDLVHTIWTGEPAPLSDLPLNAEEQRKAITTHLMAAPVSVVFDDIAMLSGHALQRAVTGQTWTDRILGANKEVNLPIRTIWAATGNNVTLAGDMVRRTVLIRLESDLEHPSQRTGFKRSESELRTWVREHRAELVSACVALVAHGLAHGEPGGVTLGGFDQFACTMSRILNGIGVTGFCGNLPAVLSREDGRQAGWKGVIRAWWELHETRAIKAGDIARLIETDDDSGIIIDGETDRARAITVGKLIKTKIGAVFAFDDARLRVATAKNSKGDTVYRLEEVGSAAANGGILHQEAIAEVANVADIPLAPTFRTHARARTRTHAHGRKNRAYYFR